MRKFLAPVLFLFLGAVLQAQDLQVSRNGRFLTQADGKPLFYLADTAWAMFKELNTSEVDFYLQNRSDKKFTVIQTVAVWSLRDGFVNGNLRKPARAYWRSVDYAINKAESLGLYVALLPTWGSLVGSGEININNAEALGKFLGSRYRTKPIIWVLGGDVAGSPNQSVWESLAKGLAEGVSGQEDYSKLLITFHPAYDYNSAEWFNDAPWLDFNMRQTGHILDNCSAERVGRDYAISPTRPTLIGEVNYENIPSRLVAGETKLDGFEVRMPAYTALFSGAFGHVYGANEVYMFWDPGDSDWGAQIWGADTPWQQALDFPGATQMQYLRALMESRRFGTHVPDPSLFLSLTFTCQAAARANDGSYALLYFPGQSSVLVDLGKISGNTVNAWWFNPRDGLATAAGQYPTAAPAKFTPPTAEDWILVLDDATYGYRAPGTVN